MLKTFLLITLLYSCTLFSQNKNERVDFLFKKVNTKEPDFLKTKHFFLSKNWDSVLIYSSKALLTKPDTSLLPYYHYMRGYSFMKKKLFSETQKEYQHISPNAPFYYKVILNLGGIALEQRQFKKAISYFNEINSLPDSLALYYDKSTVIHDMGIAYFHLSDFEKAKNFLMQSTKLQQEKKDTIRLIGSYMDLANVYYEQYQDNLAIPYFEKAYQLAQKVSDFEVKRKAALNMSVVEENRKNTVKALAYRKEYEKWKDSLFNQQKIWSVAQIEKKLAVTQKQKQIDLLAAENKLKANQRNNLLLSSSLLLLLLLTSTYFYFQKSKNHQIIAKQKEELDLLNQTKDKLFSVVSHDLRSSVDLMKKNHVKTLQEAEAYNNTRLNKVIHTNIAVATSTYNLLENLLNWATLQTEQLYFYMESVDLYSIMQQIEFNYTPLFQSKNITFCNTVPRATFIFADIDSLKIIIRNLLDNAIKFTNEKGKISVYTELKEGFVTLMIEDNGIGMNEKIIGELLKETPLLTKKRNQQEIGTGLGFQLCKSLVEKNKATLSIKSSEGYGTTILLKFLTSS